MPKVSVIVTVYNAENYIEKCIDSLLNQSFHDFEVILIDDGSKDSSGYICDVYANSNENIHVYHQENKGVVAARNAGIFCANGEYISFVDADDWVEPNFLEILTQLMDKESADVVITGCIEDKGTCSKKSINNIPVGTYCENRLEEFYGQMLHYDGFYKFGVLPYLCTKLFRKDLLMKQYLKIDRQINDGEDVATVFPYLLSCKKIVVSSDCLYHYVYRSNSMCHLKKENYYENVCRLYLYLSEQMKDTSYYDLLRDQMDKYMCMMIWQTNKEFLALSNQVVFPFDKIDKGSRIILYGAGLIGKQYFRQLQKCNYCEVVAWVDRNNSDELIQLGVEPISKIGEACFDNIVIAIGDEIIKAEVVEMLTQKFKIERERII